ncbi:uncharacterized protein METZ01_LOCUS423596 [marine metagenome]|uniref:Uncharacterized protein n=1 Tax=marine metagenome TaxID=408172 RepID=A0A382XI11_9ZZZZ
MNKNKKFSILGALLLFVLPHHHNQEYFQSHLIAEGFGFILAVAILSIIFSLMFKAGRKLIAFLFAINLGKSKIQYLTLFAWLSCTIAVLLHCIIFFS